MDSLHNKPFLNQEFIGDNEHVEYDQHGNEVELKKKIEVLNPDVEPEEPADPDEMQPHRKYKFKSLNNVMNPENYDLLLEQPKKNFQYYKDSKGTFIMNLSTEKSYQHT